MVNPTPLQKTRIRLRAKAVDKALITRAAALLGQSCSRFVLESSLQRAEAVLADQNYFVLSEPQWDRFMAALAAPLPDPEALRRLLARTPLWER